MSASDRDLVEAFVRDGDEDSFRQLFERHSAYMMALARRMIGDHDQAGDVLQEAWIRAARGLPSVHWTSTLRTWLAGIVVNCCRERRRSSARRSEVGLPEDLGAECPAGARRIEPFELERAVAELPDGYRSLIVLHDVHGHTHQEIADMLGIDVGTAKSQLWRGRRALRRLLSGGPARRFR